MAGCWEPGLEHIKVNDRSSSWSILAGTQFKVSDKASAHRGWTRWKVDARQEAKESLAQGK